LNLAAFLVLKCAEDDWSLYPNLETFLVLKCAEVDLNLNPNLNSVRFVLTCAEDELSLIILLLNSIRFFCLKVH